MKTCTLKKQFLVTTHQHLQVCLVKRMWNKYNSYFKAFSIIIKINQIEFQLLAPVDQFEFQLWLSTCPFETDVFKVWKHCLKSRQDRSKVTPPGASWEYCLPRERLVCHHSSPVGGMSWAELSFPHTWEKYRHDLYLHISAKTWTIKIMVFFQFLFIALFFE